jgi:hypothetical protein
MYVVSPMIPAKTTKYIFTPFMMLVDLDGDGEDSNLNGKQVTPW